MVNFYTMAYNAERTLPRTIQSVLEQANQDFVYYLLDNGSTDGTWAQITDIAERDRRFVPLKNAVNYVWERGNHWSDVVNKLSAEDWFCFLDADDTYKPDFLEKMLAFAQGKNLDMMICGSDFVDAVSGDVTGVRRLHRDLIIEGEGFSFFFTQYHQFMRTTWGKLIKVHLMQRFDFKHAPKVSYGGDTLFLLEFCRTAKRIGILSEPLHQYYVSPRSLSFTVQNDRIQAIKYLYSKAEKLLLEKCGQISPRNHDFLLCTFLYDAWDAISLILRSNRSSIEKLNYISQLFDFPPAKELLTERHPGRLCGISQSSQETRWKLFTSLTDWMLDLEEVPDEQMERFCGIGELASAAVDRTEQWIAFKKLRIAYFLDRAHRQIKELEELGIDYKADSFR